jgi:hypothetical protein
MFAHDAVAVAVEMAINGAQDPEEHDMDLFQESDSESDNEVVLAGVATYDEPHVEPKRATEAGSRVILDYSARMPNHLIV